MQAPQLIWTQYLGTSSSERGNALATDHLGNVFIGGHTLGEMELGQRKGSGDAFFTKYNSAGDLLWTRQLGSAQRDYIYAIDTDQLGNVLIGGFTLGALGDGQNQGDSDAFLAKYSTSGDQLWLRQLGTAGYEYLTSLATDNEGNIFVLGYTDGELESGHPQGQDDIFIAKYDPSGNQLWLRQLNLGTNVWRNAEKIATDDAGNVYIGGSTRVSITAEPAQGGYDIFLVKYNKDGQQTWIRQYGTSGSDTAHGIAIDNTGNIIIAGMTSQQWGDDTNLGQGDALLVKYDPNGQQIWSRQLGTEEEDYALDVATDKLGNIFICGATGGAFVAGVQVEEYGIFIAKYNPNGRLIWRDQFESYQESNYSFIAPDNLGHVYAGGTTLESPAGVSVSNNVFVRKYQDLPTGLLAVPLHLKGLYVDRPMRTVGPTTDFSYLPWNDGQRDYNPDFAPLGEHVTSRPMDSATGELQPGIHLHWTLPHGLSSPITKADGTRIMPYVPVQWHIIPIAQTGPASLAARTLWSDALWPEDTPINQNKSIVPVPYRPAHPSYRYMGRTTELGDTPPSPATGETAVEYFSGSDYQDKPLDCLGYGSLYFAPFYPNSREVFGHYQALEGDEDLSSATYFVSAKLYQAGDNSLPINQLMQDTGLELREILEQMEWPLNAAGGLPEEIFISGAVTIDTSLQADAALQSQPGRVNFSLGNTGTEALSALIAKELAAVHSNRDAIEEQLEAILMHDKISGRSADLGLQFLEQRHKQGFRKSAGGTQWNVHVKQKAEIIDVAIQKSDQPSQTFLTSLEDLDQAIIELNEAQQVYDKYAETLESMQSALFGDWYKYMLTKYPPPESLEIFDAAAYPQTGEVGAWTQHRAQQLQQQANQLTAQATTLESKKQQVHDRIEEVKIKSADPLLLPFLPVETVEVSLLEHPANPYYAANDPVVLIEGLDISQPDLKQAALGPDNYLHDIDLSAGSLMDKMQNVFTSLFPNLADVPSETGWSPFILEWEAAFLPALDSYGKNAPQNNFSITENQPEAQLQEQEGYRNSNASVLRGRTFLSPGAKVRKMAVLEDFLTRKLSEGSLVQDEMLPALVDAYLATHAGQSDSNNAILTAARAYTALANKTILSQALGGFNAALLQLENYEQPPLGDPLGTEAEQYFSEAIGSLVGRAAKYAPNPSNPFAPVRAGSFRLTGLRIIDTWGRYRDLLAEQDFVPAIAQSMRPMPNKSSKPTWANLPLRLSQAMRLHVNWLAAPKTFIPDDANLTDETLPGVSPVLGWLNTNHLDQSLQFFNANGEALGYFNREAEALLPPPGSDQAQLPSDLPSSIQQLINLVQANDSTWMHDFVQATQSALAHIAPDESVLSPHTAILMGRPIGIARLQLRFDIKGIPAQDHSWQMLKEQIKNLQRGQNSSDIHWEKMMFPVLLGTYMKLNDGLVGFWQENEQGRLQGPLHTMAAETAGTGILPHYAERTLWLPLDGTPVNLTVLFDPRGSIHATTGALPIQHIQLQREHYSDALNHISSWFLNAPMVQAQSSEELFYASPPAEPGFSWSWVEKQADQSWQETHTFNAPSERATLQRKAVLREGWLKLERD